jgi:hypothetical protein
VKPEPVPMYDGQRLFCRHCFMFKSKVYPEKEPFTYICEECRDDRLLQDQRDSISSVD